MDSVHRMAGDEWQAPAKRLTQNIWALLGRKLTKKYIDLSPMPNRPLLKSGRTALEAAGELAR